ncbi:YraN family protein [Tsuneonella amylolytica]|uniref:YraN family protein n=1 Tax=Tsuneonella amylolytica TaxID=2338327 RepID=UPI000EA8BA84|nr:YraN family protein [Tsuneonella amylolytica]
MKRQRAEREGRKGELAAELFLRAKGWSIVDRRRKTPVGEIDLVARRAGTVAFIEVKWRRKADDLDFAIDEYRLRRVAAAAEAVAHEYAREGEDLRVDVVLLAPGRLPHHIVNAWQP